MQIQFYTAKFRQWATTIVVSILLVATMIAGVEAATIEFSPANANFERGCLRSVAIEIDASGFNSNAADVEISFDPNQVTIIDSIPSQPGVQVRPGTAYQSYFYNQVDQTNGVIQVAAGSFTGTLSSRQVFAVIDFVSAPTATTTQFNVNFTGVGDTLDSNVADAATSVDLLSGVVNGNYTFVNGPCVADTQAPNIIFQNPTNGQQGVPPNAPINVRITDNQSGVDLTTVAIVVNGETYVVGDPELTYTGSSLDYSFVVQPSTPLPVGAGSTIAVTARDNASNRRNSQIIFNQPAPVTPPPPPAPAPPAASPPQIQFVNPTGFLAGYDEDGSVVVNITDEEGVDLDSVVININGEIYVATDPEVEVSGDANDYTFVITPGTPFPDDTYSVIRVDASDVNGSSVSDYIVFNMPGSMDIPPLLQCPVSPGESEEGNICYGDSITAGDSLDFFSKLISGDGIEDFLAGTPFEGTIMADLTKSLGLTGLVALLMGALLGLNLLALFSLLNLPVLLLNLLGILTAKDKGRPWGIVYDGSTEKPIAFAVCKLYLAGTTTVVNQTVSDLEGRYGFIISTGKYRLEVSQSGYVTHVQDIVVESDERSAVDDVALYTKELAKTSSNNIFKALGKKIALLYRQLMPYIFALGFASAILSIIYSFSVINVIILGLYILFLALYMLPFFTARRRSRSSAVIDADTGLRVPYAIVKVFDLDTWKLVDTQSTNYNGRFDFWLPAGEYGLLVAKKGYSFPSKKSKGEAKDSKFNSLLIVRLKKGNNNIEVFVDPRLGNNKETADDTSARKTAAVDNISSGSTSNSNSGIQNASDSSTGNLESPFSKV